MGIAQLSRQLSKNVEHELTHIFAIMGDSYLPEAAHTYIPTTDQTFKGMDASGVLNTGNIATSNQCNKCCDHEPATSAAH